MFQRTEWVSCNTASHLSVRFPQSEVQLALPSSPTDNRCCSPDSSSHQRNMRASQWAAIRWAGWALEEARLCRPFHHCHGPWHNAYSQLPFSRVTGHRQPQKVGEDRLRHPPPQMGAQTNLSDSIGLIALISMAMGYPPPFLRRGYPD